MKSGVYGMRPTLPRIPSVPKSRAFIDSRAAAQCSLAGPPIGPSRGVRNRVISRFHRFAPARRDVVVPAFGRTRGATGHDVLDLLGVNRLVLDERVRHGVEALHVLLEDPLRALVVAIDDVPDLLVDEVGRLVRHQLVLGHRVAEEHLALVLAVLERAEAVGQPPSG